MARKAEMEVNDAGKAAVATPIANWKRQRRTQLGAATKDDYRAVVELFPQFKTR